MSDYFYVGQEEQFAFYRIPKVLFKNPRYKTLTTDARALYGILLDRMELSRKNRWLDDLGRVYIIYTIEELMEDLGCAQQKAVKLLNELEKINLIERKRQGLCKPNLIYVKTFLPAVDNSGPSQIRSCENHNSGTVENTIPELRKSQGNNTDSKNTDKSDTDPFLSGSESDEMRNRRSCEEYFKSSLCWDILLQNNQGDQETLEGILELLVDTCCSKRQFIRIAGDDKPIEVVKSRLMKLDTSHIEYVLHCLTENTTKVRNMKQYLLTTLYNAPITISPYYQSWVNYDFGPHGGQ